MTLFLSNKYIKQQCYSCVYTCFNLVNVFLTNFSYYRQSSLFFGAFSKINTTLVSIAT